jgi:hypothetical protein
MVSKQHTCTKFIPLRKNQYFAKYLVWSLDDSPLDLWKQHEVYYIEEHDKINVIEFFSVLI